MLSTRDDKWVENRIRWKASRYDLPTVQAFEMDDVPAAHRDWLLAAAEENEVGIPVLVFLGDESRWTLVGTRKVISSCGDNLRQCRLSEIESVRRRVQPTTEKDLECLEVKLREGGVSTIWAPRGGEVFALWSTLEMFCRQPSPNRDQ